MPIQIEICRRRAIIFHIAGTVQKHDDRLQKKHRKSTAEDPLGLNKNSQQPKIQQTNRSKDRRHSGRSLTDKRGSTVSQTNRNVRAARNDRNKEPNQSSVDIICEIQARVDIDIVSFTAQTAFIHNGHNAHADVWFWHLDTIA